MAERFVDTFKRSLKKIVAGGETLDAAIDTFLLCYRSTPCRNAPDGKSPAENMFGRQIRTSLELLRPPTPSHKLQHNAQEVQFNRKHGTQRRSYNTQDLVWAKVYKNNKWHWEPGTIIERIGMVMYNIWLTSKRNLVRSHCNQLRTRYDAEDEGQTEHRETDPSVPLSILLSSWGLQDSSHEEPSASSVLPAEMLEDLTQPSQQPRSNIQQQLAPIRRSSRQRVPPQRYDASRRY